MPASVRLYAETPAELRDAVRWPAVVYVVTTTPSIPSTTRMPTAMTMAIPSSFEILLTADPPNRLTCRSEKRCSRPGNDMQASPGDPSREGAAGSARERRARDAGTGGVAQDDLVVELERPVPAARVHAHHEGHGETAEAQRR